MNVKYNDLTNDLQKYVMESSHYTVDEKTDEIHDEWNDENLTAEDIEEEQQTYDEKGEL